MPPATREILLTAGADIARRAAELFVAAAQAAVRRAASFSRRPRRRLDAENALFFARHHPTLRNNLPWDKMQLFFGDERHVGPGRFAKAITKWPRHHDWQSAPKAEQIHRMKGEFPDARQAAAEYQARNCNTIFS